MRHRLSLRAAVLGVFALTVTSLTTAPAFATGASIVQGTFTDHGTPLSGDVELLDTSGTLIQYDAGLPDGKYAFNDPSKPVQPGTYVVGFRADSHREQYAYHALTPDAAARIVVGVGTTEVDDTLQMPGG